MHVYCIKTQTKKRGVLFFVRFICLQSGLFNVNENLYFLLLSESIQAHVNDAGTL